MGEGSDHGLAIQLEQELYDLLPSEQTLRFRRHKGHDVIPWTLPLSRIHEMK